MPALSYLITWRAVFIWEALARDFIMFNAPLMKMGDPNCRIILVTNTIAIVTPMTILLGYVIYL